MKNRPIPDFKLNGFPFSAQTYFPVTNVIRNFRAFVTGTIVETPSFVDANVQTNVTL